MRTKGREKPYWGNLPRLILLLPLLLIAIPATVAQAANITAHVVALEQFLTFNRMGAVNPRG